jgi:NAD(P)H-hydrate repair Nnr-like enzyme with NAD(P)H-hydrate dehydratase domain
MHACIFSLFSPALRSGVDLVYTAVPKSNIAPLRSFSPNVIALPFPDDRFTIGPAKKLLKILPKKPDVVAIGMGMAIEKKLQYSFFVCKSQPQLLLKQPFHPL